MLFGQYPVQSFHQGHDWDCDTRDIEGNKCLSGFMSFRTSQDTDMTEPASMEKKVNIVILLLTGHIENKLLSLCRLNGSKLIIARKKKPTKLTN